MLSQHSPGDFPANPLEKAGYRLDFHDEFNGCHLDSSRWFPYYLPHWSSRLSSAPDYQLENGYLVLQITENQQPWCPEFDGQVKCSSIQTGEFSGSLGSSIGQHRFNNRLIVREEQLTVQTYTPKYGYFELRAKGSTSPANHVALWMIGFEDEPARSGEIAICEIMGQHITPGSSMVGYGVRSWYDPDLKNEFHEDTFSINAASFHIYAAEWTPTHINFFIDNVKTRTIQQSPTYPMQFMLSIYELPEKISDNKKHPYPRQFIVDYFRAYQPVNGY